MQGEKRNRDSEDSRLDEKQGCHDKVERELYHEGKPVTKDSKCQYEAKVA